MRSAYAERRLAEIWARPETTAAGYGERSAGRHVAGRRRRERVGAVAKGR